MPSRGLFFLPFKILLLPLTFLLFFFQHDDHFLPYFNFFHFFSNSNLNRSNSHSSFLYSSLLSNSLFSRSSIFIYSSFLYSSLQYSSRSFFTGAFSPELSHRSFFAAGAIWRQQPATSLPTRTAWTGKPGRPGRCRWGGGKKRRMITELSNPVLVYTSPGLTRL